MLADPYPCLEYSFGRSPQHAARVAIGLTGVGLGCPFPVGTSQRVAAAGLDHRVAISSGVEAGSETNMKRNWDRKRGRTLFCKTSIDHRQEGKGGEDVSIRVN